MDLPIRLLLIEDDILDQKAFKRAVLQSRMPFDYTIESSYRAAAKRLGADHDAANRQLAFDVVVADYALGDGTALELLPLCQSIPLIIVTGAGDEGIAVSAIKSGVYDYLIKDRERNYLAQLPRVVENALHRKRLETAEREQREFADMLRDTAAALASTLELEEILRRVLVNVKRIIPHDTANIMLVEGHKARIAQVAGFPPEAVQMLSNLEIDIDVVHNLRVMYHTGEPINITDVSASSHWVLFPGAPVPASYLGAPIRVGDEVIGFLSLDSAEIGFFQPVHAERLLAFGDHMAVALENAKLYKQAQESAVLRERQRLARDLHDSITQTLFAASVMVDAVTRQWQHRPDSIGPELAELRDLTHGALAEMRNLLLEFSPNILREADLGELLRQLLRTLKGRARLEAEAVIEGQGALPDNVHLAFFRIAQEALNNITKHARARRVMVRLTRAPGQAALIVQDDGRGFNPAAVGGSQMGLHIMAERAEEAGIELNIETSPGAGVTVSALWKEHEKA